VKRLPIASMSEAYETIGGLSQTSKMPGRSLGLPAQRCKVGSRLRGIAGSTCSDCYACKGQYQFPVVKNAQERRYQALKSIRRWTEGMCFLLTHNAWKEREVFRWHDSGDVANLSHLRAICEVADRTPHVRHWLPTREVGYVNSLLDVRDVPSNLTIRISAPMIGQTLRLSPRWIQAGIVTSSVDSSSADSHACNAPKQNGECRSCRACWSRNVADVTYKVH